MKLAIFGGTFDPIHVGHLEVATAAADELELNRILFIPASRPPHKAKQEQVPFENRYEMVRLACEKDDRFEPSRLEEPGQDRPSYSIHTIERVREDLAKEDRLFVILGADAFNDVPTWYRVDDVLRQAEFIVVSRPGKRISTIPNAEVNALRSVDNPISASSIRSRLRRGASCGDALTPEVQSYVEARGLYRAEAAD